MSAGRSIADLSADLADRAESFCRQYVNRHTILTPYRRPKMTPLERSGSWPDAV